MSEYCHHNNTASHCMECIAEQLGSRKAPKPRPQVPTDKQATDAATIQSFVAGLMFDDEMQRVVLIRKDRPAWQRGLLNGVGGKMEDGEGSIDTMLREFKEEAGVQTTRSDWSYFMQLRGDQFYVDFFFGRSTEHFEAAHTTESEKLVKLEVEQLHSLKYEMVPCLDWAVPMAVHASTGRGVSFAQVYIK